MSDNTNMDWNYNNKKLIKRPENSVGFVYKITNLDTEQMYIGKKSFIRKRTRPPLKGYKRKRVDYIESDWKTYQSSNKEVQGWKNVYKEILFICDSKIDLTYYEAKALFCEGTIESKNKHFVNGNILGKFYKGRIK